VQSITTKKNLLDFTRFTCFLPEKYRLLDNYLFFTVKT
jgi:hypothetical protein